MILHKGAYMVAQPCRGLEPLKCRIRYLSAYLAVGVKMICAVFVSCFAKGLAAVVKQHSEPYFFILGSSLDRRRRVTPHVVDVPLVI